MLEYEKKIMLTEKEYFAIIELMCRHEPCVIQTNYYFDTDDYRMNEKRITCRIREKDRIYKTIVKNHGAIYTNCSTEIELGESMELDPQIFNALGLCCHGKLITERIVVLNDSRCKMVLDRNTYLGHTDFELELEYRKGEERCTQNIFENVALGLLSYGLLDNINEFFARVGNDGFKSQRFFERLKNSK